MLPIAWGALLQAAAPAIVNTVGNVISGRNNRRHSVDMWKKQQEYNLPKNQMARLENAGINPHLAFSTGISNTAQSAPQTMPIMPGQMSTQDMLTDKRRDEIGQSTELKAVQTAISDWNVKSSEAKARLDQLTTQVEQAKIRGGFQNFDAYLEKGGMDMIQGYANTLRNMEINQWQAQKLVDNMRGRLAENDMTPNDSIQYRVILKVFELLGFEIPDEPIMEN